MNFRNYQRLLMAISIAIASMAPLGVAAENAGPVVLTKTVTTESIRPSFSHPARIEAVRTGSVRPVLRARIDDMHITPGAIVEKGDLLLEMDETDYRIAVAQAEANLKQAEANAVKADLDLDRAQKLVQSNAVSQREVDYAKAQWEVAHAQVDIAKALIEQAQEDLADTKVYAPFSGRISAPIYAVGDLYAPGDPTSPAAVAEIVSLDPIYATGLVDQSNYFSFLARRLKLEEAGRSIPPLEIEVILPGNNTYPLKGTFENWDNTAVASTGTIAARVLFSNPQGTLLPGQTVTIRGQLIEAVEAPLVPQRAVSLDQQGHYVWVVTTDATAERRNVEVGIRSGADWTVLDGLVDGDKVVVEGLQKLRPGLAVTPKPYEG